MSEIEKRTVRRKAIALRIKLRYDGVDAFIAKFATNVSRAGLFIRSKKPKDAGTIVRFELQLADGKAVVKGRGEVRWTRPFDPEKPRAHYGMGIAFTNLDEASTEMIERIVKHREAQGGDFEAEKIPYRTPTADPAPAEEPEPALSSQATPEAAVPKTPPSQPVRRPLAPEAKKRPRATLEEVLARAEPEGATAPDPGPDLEDNVSVASALERARQITEVGLGETDALLSELEAGGAVVHATPEEASQRLAALFGDLPVRGRRRERDVQAAPPSEPEPLPAEANALGSSLDTPVLAAIPEAITELEIAPALGGAPAPEPEPEPEPEPPPPDEQEAPVPTPSLEEEPIPEPIDDLAAGSGVVSFGGEGEGAWAKRPPPANEIVDEPGLRQAPGVIDLDEPETLPVSLDDALKHLDPGLELELDIGDDVSTSVEGEGPLDEIEGDTPIEHLDPVTAVYKDEPDGSFASKVFDARTVARPGLAAALADAGEVLASKPMIAEPAEPLTEVDEESAWAKRPAPADADDEFPPLETARTEMEPDFATSFAAAKPGALEPDLDDDIEAALDALIPDDFSRPVTDADRSSPDLDIGDKVGFHHLPPSEPDEPLESDDVLFPPIAEAEPEVPQDDYIISFQPEGAEPPSPEPDATFERAQGAIDQVIDEFDGPTNKHQGVEIDLDDHLEVDAPGAEGAPTFITDMPSAALASDLVHDLDNKISGGRALNALLEPEEPFETANEDLVHGVGDFFDPQPLSEEVPIDEVAAKGPPLAVPPPIPKPPPIPVKALTRPPDTIPTGDSTFASRIKAPGLPTLPEEEIDIDISLDEFDESPAVVAGAPIPTAVTADESTGEDDDEPKKKGLFGRLFRKS